MPVYKVVDEKEEKQKLNERIILALLVLAGVAIVHVFVSFSDSAVQTFPDTAESREEYLLEMQRNGIIAAVNYYKGEVIVRTEEWNKLDRPQRVELTFIAATVCSERKGLPLPKARILGDVGGIVLAKIDENNLSVR